jgi:hypothetical protein
MKKAAVMDAIKRSLDKVYRREDIINRYISELTEAIINREVKWEEYVKEVFTEEDWTLSNAWDRKFRAYYDDFMEDITEPLHKAEEGLRDISREIMIIQDKIRATEELYHVRIKREKEKHHETAVIRWLS